MAINVKNKIKVLGIILFGILSVSLASCGSDTEVKGDNIIVTKMVLRLLKIKMIRKSLILKIKKIM